MCINPIPKHKLMKMKMKLTVMTLLLTMTIGLWAQNTTQRLVVWQKNGEKVYFDLAEEPKTTFEDGKLVIKTTKTTVYYHLENVLRYTYEGEIPNVDGMKLKPGEIRFFQGKDKMAFDGLPNGQNISVYSLDGKLLKTQTSHSGQQTVISLTSYPTGTYIVKVGDATYEFQKQ